MEERVIKAIERVIVGGVAITARAIGDDTAELTLMQWRVLVVAGENAGGLHVGVVARRIGASPPSTSRILRRLEHRGFIDLVRDDGDRRYMLVRLTRRGRALHDRLVKRRLELIRAALSSDHDRHPAGLAEALETISSDLLANA